MCIPGAYGDGAIFAIIAKFVLKTAKNMVFYALCMPMGRATAPSLLRYCVCANEMYYGITRKGILILYSVMGTAALLAPLLFR